jgi:hypothetical protein
MSTLFMHCNSPQHLSDLFKTYESLLSAPDLKSLYKAGSRSSFFSTGVSAAPAVLGVLVSEIVRRPAVLYSLETVERILEDLLSLFRKGFVDVWKDTWSLFRVVVERRGVLQGFVGDGVVESAVRLGETEKAYEVMMYCFEVGVDLSVSVLLDGFLALVKNRVATALLNKVCLVDLLHISPLQKRVS